MTFAVAQSSLNKGESLRDTIETVGAMGVDAFVVRHGSSGAPWQVGEWTTAAVVNAGDGWHAHPTQALLDAYTAPVPFLCDGDFLLAYELHVTNMDRLPISLASIEVFADGSPRFPPPPRLLTASRKLVSGPIAGCIGP